MTTLIDDRDTSISYTATGSEVWQHGGVSEEYMRTTTSTAVKGNSVTLRFSGTSVGVYGTVNSQGAADCSYSIDDGDPIDLTAPVPSGVRYQVQLFQSSELMSGSHTLVITILSNSSSKILFLDFFAVTQFSPSSTLVLSSTQVFSSTHVISVTTTTTSQPVSSKPPGPIIGGVLGGLALLTFAFITFMFFRRRNKDRLHPGLNEPNNIGNGGLAMEAGRDP